MSQAPHSHDEGPIQTPKQLIVAVVLAFVVPVLIIALLVTYVNSTAKSAAGSNAQSPEAIAQRLMPVGAVQIKAASVAPGSRLGEEVYKAQCASCHATGALGSPKFGDAAAWGSRIGAGVEALLTAALKGKNAMPAQGGGEFVDIEIKRAVVYMANAGGAKFEAPAVAAGGGDLNLPDHDAVFRLLIQRR
jgi:cytochrome c5